MRFAIALLLLLTLLIPPSTADAWGVEGHQIIGLIAEHYLTRRAHLKIMLLLAQDTSGLADSTSIADEAVWADRFRDSDRNGSQVNYRQTQAWHYVDLETDRPDMSAACADHACIVDKINEFAKELADPAMEPQRRLRALQFLLHLVGDLHQPLHAADQHDRGGNNIPSRSGSERPGNLHQYWDSVFVARLGSPSGGVAKKLIAEISPQQLREWRAGSVTDWAYESFSVAQRDVYGPLPSPDYHGVHQLDDAYTRNATIIVATQLQRAGVRLAAMLNKALR